VEAELPIPRAEALATGGAVEIGALQLQRPQHTFERLLTPTSVAGQLPALTAALCRVTIGPIRVETLLDSAARQTQRLPANRNFERSQVKVL
jgi:hypothetical protein